MPTYGYRCTECGNEFDVRQRMSDEPGAACPVCSAPGKRLFFPAGIVFKGAGFYKTDSRGASSASAPASATSAPSGSPSNGVPAKEASSSGSPPTTPAPTPASGGGD